MEEIKQIIESGELYEEKLYVALTRKREYIRKQLHEQEKRLYQLECDISNLKNGKPIMSYLYLNEGHWNGRQIISDKWIFESTQVQSV